MLLANILQGSRTLFACSSLLQVLSARLSLQAPEDLSGSLHAADGRKDAAGGGGNAFRMLGQQGCRPVVADPAALVQLHFDFVPTVRCELDSFNDRNWLVRRTAQAGSRGTAQDFVLKVHNHLDSADRGTIEVRLTPAVLAHLHAIGATVIAQCFLQSGA